MVERSLVPFQGEEIIKRPSLSTQQQDELLGLGRRYSRAHNLLLSEQTLEKIMGVLGDALVRQLRTENRQSVEENERLDPLIKKGLDQRELVRSPADFILNLTLKNPTTNSEITGPLAIPQGLINPARVELGNFPLTAKLTVCQELVDLYQQRLAMVDRFAQIGLSHLPERFSDVTLDRFPEIADKVKLIRNMIAAYVFNETLSPVISTLRLKSFVDMIRSPSLYFTVEVKTTLIGSLGINSEQEMAFISDLFIQTATAFAKNSYLAEGYDPKKIDSFYRNFSKDLLILHPAIEEIQITTIPQKAQTEPLTLWDEATVVDQAKIPGPDLLAQAARQASARGDKFNEERLKGGLREWRWFNEEAKKHQSKIQELEQEFVEREQLFLKLDEPQFPLPKEAHLIRYQVQAKARREAIYRARSAQELVRVLEENLKEQAEAQTYEEFLNAKYGDNWPKFVPLSRQLYVRELREKEKKFRNQEDSIKGQLSIVEDLLHLDYFWQRVSHSVFGYFYSDDAQDLIQQEIDQTRKQIEQFKVNPSDSPFREVSLQALDKHIAPYFTRRGKMPTFPRPLNEYLQFWANIFFSLEKAIGEENQELFLANITPQVLTQRVNLLEYVLSITNRKSKRLQRLENIRMELREFLGDPQKPLPENAIWSSAEAKAYIMEVKASNLPNLEVMNMDELASQVRPMRSFLAILPLTHLPELIPPKEKFISWVNERVTRTKTQIMDGEQQLKNIVSYSKSEWLSTYRRTEKLRMRLALFEQLSSFMQDTLCPLPEGVGLPREQFLRAWRNKVDLAYAIYFQKEMQTQSQEAQEQFDNIMREIFKETLEQELKSRKGELDKLKQRDLEKKLVDRMRRLNLVLEENPTIPTSS